MTLIEKLVTFAIILILSSILLPAVSKSYMNAKLWIWGSFALHENRLNAVMDDKDQLAEIFLANKVHKWTVINKSSN